MLPVRFQVVVGVRVQGLGFRPISGTADGEQAVPQAESMVVMVAAWGRWCVWGWCGAGAGGGPRVPCGPRAPCRVGRDPHGARGPRGTRGPHSARGPHCTHGPHMPPTVHVGRADHPATMHCLSAQRQVVV